MKYIRTKDGIFELDSEKTFFAIRDTSVNDKNCYISYLWDNWKSYFLIDSLNCILFSYNSAQAFIGNLMQENLNYKNLVIEVNQYYKDCPQSDTIEELCDGFYLDLGKEFDDTYLRRKDRFEFLKELALEYMRRDMKVTLYGVIKTSKGLIYVAKLNSDGKLILL